ncbi:MAG TPA: myristoyl transferase, partial [Anaerolineae bacterium]|nr:myristoyl transferase [Anaerolineae bacterium]
MKKTLLLTILILLLLVACGSRAQNNGDVVTLRLPMGYIPDPQYAPFYVAAERGYFATAGYEIEFDYSFETDGMALVGMGDVPFAVVSGE